MSSETIYVKHVCWSSYMSSETTYVNWDNLCLLGQSMSTGTIYVYWDNLCQLGQSMFTGTICVNWGSLYLLGRAVATKDNPCLLPKFMSTLSEQRFRPNLSILRVWRLRFRNVMNSSSYHYYCYYYYCYYCYYYY